MTTYLDSKEQTTPDASIAMKKTQLNIYFLFLALKTLRETTKAILSQQLSPENFMLSSPEAWKAIDELPKSIITNKEIEQLTRQAEQQQKSAVHTSKKTTSNEEKSTDRAENLAGVLRTKCEIESQTQTGGSF